MEISTSTAAEKAKLHDKITKELKTSALDTVEKANKEKFKGEEAEQAVKVLKESIRIANTWVSEAKKSIEGLEKDKTILQKDKSDLQSKVDLLEAELQMLKDLQAKK